VLCVFFCFFVWSLFVSGFLDDDSRFRIPRLPTLGEKCLQDIVGKSILEITFESMLEKQGAYHCP